MFTLQAVLLSVLLWGTAFTAFGGEVERSELKAKLSGLEAFSAQFVQTLSSKDKGQGMSSSGLIALKRPQRFMLHTKEPDEQVLFTRDDAVYMYDPFVNQVSIFSLSELKNSPFLLLTSQDPQIWEQYEVTRKGESFTLTPKQRGEIQSLTVTFQGKVMTSLALLMRDGSLNRYALSAQKFEAEDSLFVYQIPADAEVDDGRRTD